jgi:hypothetical protein
MTNAPLESALSLLALVDRGDHDDHLHSSSTRPPGSPLEWLGLAVGELPQLTSSARLVDDLNWASRAPGVMRMHLGLMDVLGTQLANSAALLHHALLTYLHRRPSLGGAEEALADVDELSHALVEDHPVLSRRADVLLGGYASALAAAVQAAGRLGDSELAAVAGEPGPDPDLIASVAYDALTRALATLLGHARLNARDRVAVEGRASAEG